MRALAAVCLMGCGQILGITDPTPGMGGPTDGGFHPDGQKPFDGPTNLDASPLCAAPPTFGAATNYGVAAGADAFDVGDLDHDGLIDVVITGITSSSLVIMHGTGGGALGRQQLVGLPANGMNGATFVRAIDIDNDGFVDLVYMAFGTNHAIYAQRQDPTHAGNFLAAVDVVDVGPMFSQFAVGDVDGDGLMDIVSPDAGMSGISIALQLPASPGSFGTPSDIQLGTTGPSIQSAALGDLNHDGKLDLVGLYDGVVKYVLQKSTGGAVFEAPMTVGPGTAMIFAVKDVDGDGYDDVLIGANQTSIFFQNPAAPGTFTGGETLFPIQKLPIISDINGDGRLDVGGNGAFELQCAPPAPARTFLMQDLNGQDGAGYGDLTGDGKQEHITLDPQNAIMSVAIQQ